MSARGVSVGALQRTEQSTTAIPASSTIARSSRDTACLADGLCIGVSSRVGTRVGRAGLSVTGTHLRIRPRDFAETGRHRTSPILASLRPVQRFTSHWPKSCGHQSSVGAARIGLGACAPLQLTHIASLIGNAGSEATTQPAAAPHVRSQRTSLLVLVGIVRAFVLSSLRRRGLVAAGAGLTLLCLGGVYDRGAVLVALRAAQRCSTTTCAECDATWLQFRCVPPRPRD